MKLFYAPQSPFARKVRAAAIELGLDQRIELEYAEVVPGRPNLNFAQSRNPLRIIPALVTDAGDTIFDFNGDMRVSGYAGRRRQIDSARWFASLARADKPCSRARDV